MTIEYLQADRPRPEARRAGRRVREGPGPVRHARRAGGRLHADHRLRSVRHRAVPGRAAAAAGSRLTETGQAGVRAGAAVARREPAVRARWRIAGPWRGRRSRRNPRRRSRVGRHRVDYELHEHFEPQRHDRRRPAGQEGGRAGPPGETLGEDQPRTGLDGRDRLPRQGRPVAVPRSARLQPGRLRLHDVHRQQRAAARRRGLGREGQGPGRGVGPQRQPEFRGAHPAARPRQLPRVAAARDCLRACRDDADRPHARADRPGRGGAGRVPGRDLADRERNPGDDGGGRAGGGVPIGLRERFQG